jgi:hypothetical protein
MAQQTINIGSAPNDRTGSSLRAGGSAINSNFTELYTAVDPAGVTAFRFPRGTTAQRPTSPLTGHTRWNTSTSKLEVWTGAWSDIITAAGGTITGNLVIGNGTATVPSLQVGTTASGLSSFSGDTLSFVAGGAEQVRLAATTGAVNRLELSGSEAGAGVSIRAQGSDTNINMILEPKGTGAVMADTPTAGSYVGGNARGSYAVDWQMSRAAADQVASGLGSLIAGGGQNKATGQYATVVGGFGNVVTADHAATLGGSSNLVDAVASVAMGIAGTVRGVPCKMVHSGGTFSASAGTMQRSVTILAASTTGSTSARLTAGGLGLSPANFNPLPNNSAYFYRIDVVARNLNTNDCAVYTFSGLASRDATAASIVVTSLSANTVAESGAASWSVTVTGDATNGALNVTAVPTGVTAGHVVRWVAKVETVEVTA